LLFFYFILFILFLFYHSYVYILCQFEQQTEK